MYKCYDCGHVFDDDECGTYEERYPYGSTYATQTFSTCPMCGGDFGEAKECEICGEYFFEDELEAGYYCDECLKDAVTTDNFLEFALDGFKADEVSFLEEFILERIFYVEPNSLKNSSSELKDYMTKIYKKAVSEDKIFPPSMVEMTVRAKAVQWIDDASIWYEFAEFLHKQSLADGVHSRRV